MAKVQFQVNGLDSNTPSIFNDDVTFDGNVEANSISIDGTSITEVIQDTIGNSLSADLSYNDSTGGIAVNYVTVGNTLLNGVSGQSYGLIGTSTYLDVKDTNGYNKEIELDIAAVESQLNTDGYLTAPSQSGNSGKYLTTNGTSTSWNTVSAGGAPAFSIQHQSGRYYRAGSSGGVVNRTLVGNTTRYLPILIPESKDYDRIGFRTASNFSGTGIARLGIYNNLNGKPDTVLLDAGTASYTGINTSCQITINQTLSAGFYWLAFNSTTQAATNSIVSVFGSSTTFGHMSSSSSLDFSTASIGYIESVDVTSGFLTPGEIFASSGDFPIVAIRAT